MCCHLAVFFLSVMMHKVKGTIHLRRRHFVFFWGEGSKIGQICRRKGSRGQK